MGSYIMRSTLRSSFALRVAGAVAAVWLSSSGVAWAGDGTDLGSLQAEIGPADGSSGLCFILHMNPCPQLPTITQAVLQIAGLANSLPEMARAQNSIPPGASVTAGNPAAVPPAPNTAMPFPLDANTTPPLFLPATATNPASGLLTTLTPLAFVSQSSGTAAATQLYDSNADTFLYSVAVAKSNQPPGFVKNNVTDPDTAYFFYEDLSRSNQNFNNGQIVAKFSFQLTVLNMDAAGNSSERPVAATLSFVANNAGDCANSTVAGNFSGAVNGGTPSLSAKLIGVDCAVRFSESPTSAQPHAIFEVSVPLLVTGACFTPGCVANPNTDPAYFYSLTHSGQRNPINMEVYTAFFENDLGYPNNAIPPILGSQGVAIGLAPTALPLCASVTPNTAPSCPASTPTNPTPIPPVPFALCATLPVNNNTNNGVPQLRPSVGAYYAVATSGEMLLSAPLLARGTETGLGSGSFCPPL